MQRCHTFPLLSIATLTALFVLGQPGPVHAVEVTVHDYAGGNGLGLAGKLVVPVEPGTYPLAVVSHGWSSSAANFVGWGKVIASLGFVAVVPSFPNPIMPDNVENARIIERLAAHFGNPPDDSPAFGKVDPDRLALVAHSGGGSSAATAAMTLFPAVTVLFDPVDTTGLTKGRLDELCGPVLTIFAQPGSCNEKNAWEARVTETSGPRYSFHVIGATHCDGEKPARAACGPFCGGAATVKAQAEFQRYLEAMLKAYVLGDLDALAELEDAALSANPMLGSLSCDPTQESCVTLPWEDDSDTGQETTDEPSDTTDDTGTGSTTTGTGSQSSDEPVDSETENDPKPTTPEQTSSNANSSCRVAHLGGTPATSLLRALLFAF